LRTLVKTSKLIIINWNLVINSFKVYKCFF